MSTLNTRLIGSDDFVRAFDMAERLVQYELKMKWLPDLMTPGAANDTMAAIVQAKALVLHIFQSGYSLEDMHRWVDMLVRADEEERGRVAAASEVFQPTPVVTVWEKDVPQSALPWVKD